MANSLRSGNAIKGILLCADKQERLFFRRGAIFRSEDGKAPELLCRLPGPAVLRLAAKWRPIERLLRKEPRFAVRAGDHIYLISWSGGLYLLDTRTKAFRLVQTYRDGMNNPLSIAKISSVKGFQDGFLYGDYWGNLEMEEVGVYYCDGTKAQKVFAFPAGKIRHIHGLCPDAENGRILICTGDSDAESGIWEAKAGFRDVQPLLVGEQRFRTCAAYPVKNGILYATDTPLGDNYIYHYNETTKELTELYALNGPCIYSRKVTGADGRVQYLFATSVEPDSSRSGWRYVLSSKLGKGVHSRYATVVCGSPEDGFREIIRLKKDIWPMVPFQFGNFRLPETEDGTVFAVGQSVSKLDGKTLWMRTK